MLFFCARLDDPYADWWLVKVEDALQHAAVRNGQLRQRIDSLLAAKRGMHVDIAESLSPIQVPLKFGNPYASQGAVLLTEFDVLVRSILTARHVGFLDRNEAERTLLYGGRAVHRVFASATGFQNQSVKRKDIHENNARARKAQELMGQIPDDILMSARRAKHAPEPISTDPQEGLSTDTTLFASG
jgi:integrating conjugative element protein (TIGR03761 family)